MERLAKFLLGLVINILLLVFVVVPGVMLLPIVAPIRFAWGTMENMSDRLQSLDEWLDEE
jgi:hypothetical protein